MAIQELCFTFFVLGDLQIGDMALSTTRTASTMARLFSSNHSVLQDLPEYVEDPMQLVKRTEDLMGIAIRSGPSHSRGLGDREPFQS